MVPACLQGDCCVPRARQCRQGRQGKAGLPGQHLHRGIPGSQACRNANNPGEFTKRQTGGTAPEPGTKAAGELWQGEAVGLGLLVASGHQPVTRKPPHAPPQLPSSCSHSGPPQEPGRELSILVQVPVMQPWPGDGTSPALGRRF